MAKRAMSQIMPQRNGIGQILIQTQCPGNRLRNGRHIEGMVHPRGDMVAFRRENHLGLVAEPPESRAMENPMGIPLE